MEISDEELGKQLLKQLHTLHTTKMVMDVWKMSEFIHTHLHTHTHPPTHLPAHTYSPYRYAHYNHRKDLTIHMDIILLVVS